MSKMYIFNTDDKDLLSNIQASHYTVNNPSIKECPICGIPFRRGVVHLITDVNIGKLYACNRCFTKLEGTSSQILFRYKNLAI